MTSDGSDAPGGTDDGGAPQDDGTATPTDRESATPAEGAPSGAVDPDPSGERDPASAVERRIEAELRGNTIDVERVAVDDAVALTYTTAFPAEEANHGEIGRALSAFLDLIEAGELEPIRVEATVERFPGDVQATWHAAADWFEGLGTYRLSETEFSRRVLDTLEHSDGGDGGSSPGGEAP